MAKFFRTKWLGRLGRAILKFSKKGLRFAVLLFHHLFRAVKHLLVTLKILKRTSSHHQEPQEEPLMIVNKPAKLSPLDFEMMKIQRSTRTLFPQTQRIHEKLRMRFRWYYLWHVNPFSRKVHWATLSLYTFLIIGLILSLVLAPMRLKAENYSKTWTTTADFDSGTKSNVDTSGNEAKLASSTGSFTENFTTTTYKDAATTANWDTTAHKLTLPGDPANGIPTDLETKWKTIAAKEDIFAYGYDSANQIVYLGGFNGSFGAYKPSTDAIYDLTPKISTDFGGGPIRSIIFDSTNGFMYLAGDTGKFGSYSAGADPSAGTWTYLYSKISATWSTINIYALGYDSTNAIVYLGGLQCHFGAFVGGATPSTGTFTYLYNNIVTDWVSTNGVNTLVFDPNGYMYLGGAGGKFGAWQINATPGNGTWINLTAKISGSWTTAAINGSVFDSVNGFIYLGGANAHLGAYAGGADPANGTFTYLNSKISTTWGASTPVSIMVYDSANHIIYFGASTLAYAKFGAFAGGATPANGTFTYLNSKISGDWGNGYVVALSFDPSTSTVLVGGTTGRSGKFVGGGTPANGTWTYTIEKTVLPLQGLDVLAQAYDPINKFLYIAGTTGRFAAYNTQTGAVINLTAKINYTTASVTQLAFDAVNGFIYIGGGVTGFGAISASNDPTSVTYINLTAKISGEMAGSTMDGLCIGSNGYLYIAGSAGKFAAFSIGANPADGTYISLTAKISANWGLNTVTAGLAFDSLNGYIYLGGQSGRFGAFLGGSDPANGSFIYLASKINWASGTVESLGYDVVNGIVYLGGAGGNFGAYQGGADPANGTFSGLHGKITGTWGGLAADHVYAISDNTGKLYMGGDSGNFGVLSGNSDPNAASFTDLTSKNSSFFNSQDIHTVIYAPNIATVFVGGTKGEFSSYLVGYLNNKDGISTKVNGAQTILKASLTATEIKPANTNILYYLSNNGGANWYQVNSGSEYAFPAAGADLRWKANMTTTDLTITPEVSNIAISFNYLTSSSGTLNLQFDATQTVAWTTLAWNHTLPANTTLTFMIKGAADQAGLVGATWSDAIAANASPANLKTLNFGGVTGMTDSRWAEVQVNFANTDNFSTPVLSDMVLTYVINLAPEIQSLAALQTVDGSKTVNVSYQMRDLDTATNPYNPNQVAVALQYSLNSGGAWVDAATTTGTGLQSVTNAFQTHTATWNVGADLPNSYYNGTVLVKVKLNDNEQAHSTAELASAAFTVDTKNPVPGAIAGGFTGIKIADGSTWINDNTPDLTLSATDDTALQMQVRNDANFVPEGYEAYAASKAGFPLSSGDGNKTVYVSFKDAFGNTVTASTNVNLDTTPPGTPSNIHIYDTSERSLSRFALTIIWDAVPTVLDFNNYVIERSIDGGAYAGLTTTTFTTFTDQNLEDTKTYSYRVKSTDTHGNISPSSLIVSLKPSSTDIAAPIIGGVPGARPYDTTAVISWSTNEASDSYVEFGRTVAYGNIQGSDELSLNHSIILIGLTSDTTYHFRVRSKDAANNTSVSDDLTFRTTLPRTSAGADVSAVEVTDLGLDSAIITWESSVVTSSNLLYGPTTSYGKSTEDQSLGMTTKHTIRLKTLTSGTKYHFRVSGLTDEGDVIVSDDYVFSTLAIPSISELAVSGIGSTTASITWKTNTACDSFVDLLAAEKSINSQGNSEFTTDHKVALQGLSPSTAYQFKAKSRDLYGNQAITATANFKTSVDAKAPEIKDIKSETNLITDQATGQTNVQVIISWTTDEPATSQVQYSKGLNAAGGYEKQTELNTSLSTSHVVIIPGLLPSTTYHFQIISKDGSGNTTSSPDYTVLTNRQEVSFLQVIVGVLEDTFGWVRKIKIFGGS